MAVLAGETTLRVTLDTTEFDMAQIHKYLSEETY